MAVLLIKKKNFNQGLPAGFQWEPASRKIVANESYNLITDDNDFGGRGRTFAVDNSSNIDALKDEICGKPLVSVAKCSKQYKVYRRGRDAEGNREVDYRTMSDDFVVVLNTTHPEVRQILDELFEKVKKLLNDGVKFVVVFDLDESVRLWYAQVPHENSEGQTAQAVGASFYFAHGAQPQSTCAGCFGCEQPVQKAMWIICLPCCLVTGVPYLFCRKCVQNIKDVKISTRLHTQEYNAVCPAGTNLMALFNSTNASVATVMTTQHPSHYPSQSYGQPQAPAQPYSQYVQSPMQAYPPQAPSQYPPQQYSTQFNPLGIYPPQQVTHPTHY